MMNQKRKGYDFGINIFLLAGVVVVAFLQARGLIPSGNIIVSGLAYLLGAISGVIVHYCVKRAWLWISRK